MESSYRQYGILLGAVVLSVGILWGTVSINFVILDRSQGGWTVAAADSAGRLRTWGLYNDRTPVDVPLSRGPQNLLLVPVEISGHPVKMVLDTGASTCALDRDFVENVLGVSVRSRPLSAAGTAGGHDIEMGLIAVDHFAFGTRVYRDIPCLVIPYLPEVFGGVGLLGGTVFAPDTLHVDPAAARVRLSPAPDIDLADLVGLPVTFRNGLPYAAAWFDSERPFEVVLDSGATGSSLSWVDAETAGIRKGDPMASAADGVSVDGVISRRYAPEWPVLHVGPATLRPQGDSLTVADGLDRSRLGLSVLGGREWAIDYNAGRLYLGR